LEYIKIIIDQQEAAEASRKLVESVLHNIDKLFERPEGDVVLNEENKSSKKLEESVVSNDNPVLNADAGESVNELVSDKLDKIFDKSLKESVTEMKEFNEEIDHGFIINLANQGAETQPNIEEIRFTEDEKEEIIRIIIDFLNLKDYPPAIQRLMLKQFFDEHGGIEKVFEDHFKMMRRKEEETKMMNMDQEEAEDGTTNEEPVIKTEEFVYTEDTSRTFVNEGIFESRRTSYKREIREISPNLPTRKKEYTYYGGRLRIYRRRKIHETGDAFFRRKLENRYN